MAQRRTTNRQDTNVEKICTYASERRKRTLNSFAFSLSKLKQLLFSLNISVSTSGQHIYRQIFKCTQTIQNQKTLEEIVDGASTIVSTVCNLYGGVESVLSRRYNGSGNFNV